VGSKTPEMIAIGKKLAYATGPADSALVMTELMARPSVAKHTIPRVSPMASASSPPARGRAPKASQPVSPVQALMKIDVATVLASRPPRYAPEGSGVVLIRLSTPSWRSTATLDPRFT